MPTTATGPLIPYVQKPPSVRQLVTLRALDYLIRLNGGVSPTFRELADYMDGKFGRCKSVRTVTEHVHALRARGYVAHHPHQQRTMFVTEAGIKALKEFKLPDHLRKIRLA